MKRFQFSIRDLLLIIVIAALAAGWWIDHRRLAAKNVPPTEWVDAVLAQDPQVADLRKRLDTLRSASASQSQILQVKQHLEALEAEMRPKIIEEIERVRWWIIPAKQPQP